MATKAKFRYTVRKQVSGWTGIAKYYVYDLQGKDRVTVHAVLGRDTAQAEADRLNVSDMVTPHADDPRPYEVRLAEAWARFHMLKSLPWLPCPTCKHRTVVCPKCSRCDDCGHHPTCLNRGKPLIEIL